MSGTVSSELAAQLTRMTGEEVEYSVAGQRGDLTLSSPADCVAVVAMLRAGSLCAGRVQSLALVGLVPGDAEFPALVQLARSTPRVTVSAPPAWPEKVWQVLAGVGVAGCRCAGVAGTGQRTAGLRHPHHGAQAGGGGGRAGARHEAHPGLLHCSTGISPQHLGPVLLNMPGYVGR